MFVFVVLLFFASMVPSTLVTRGASFLVVLVEYRWPWLTWCFFSNLAALNVSRILLLRVPFCVFSIGKSKAR